MKFTKRESIIFGKVDYTDAEIAAADDYRTDIPHSAPYDRQVMAVMNADVDDVAYVIMDVTESWRDMYKEEGLEYCARKIEEVGGPFAVIELEEDEDGISWHGSYRVPPTSFERAMALAIDAAKMLS